MRLIIIAVLTTFLALPAGAVSKRKQCRQACGALIAACTERTAAAGFGNLAKGCKQAVTKRCLGEGPAVCGTFCGNGTVDGAEACDGDDLGAATCASVGFASGGLACTAGCGLDTSGCVPFPPPVPPACGNGAIDSPEQCDGAALGGATCASLGFPLGGTLSCTSACGFDLTGCARPADPTCGNDVAEVGEACDGPDLHGRTCQQEGFAYGTLACAGDCTFDLAGCTDARLVDNGDGTIIDRQTGLQWEKKSDDGSVHDFDDTYGWSAGTPWVPTGTAFTDFLTALNDCTASSATGPLQGGFAGHCDWRMPTIVELMSILDLSVPGCNAGTPCVPPIFHTGCTPGCTVTTCSCTKYLLHWSFTTGATEPNSRWVLSFFQGSVGASTNMFDYNVRAVRRAGH